ncbi:MAG TPA: type II toxin-antitoxin system VapC family toxin [Stellaceae bacterium]|jgi:ribonuclease VapC|nr:type II toxin-antitoxin system VapC family toxin [Stellaceae bacterium]
MFIDASALVAIIAGEEDGRSLADRLDSAKRRYTSPLALYEANLALLRIRDASIPATTALLDDFVSRSHIDTISITPEVGRLAIDAFARFGRGHHPARLNMGDCFAYACARNLGVPLLCKGGDFAQTDIELA